MRRWPAAAVRGDLPWQRHARPPPRAPRLLVPLHRRARQVIVDVRSAEAHALATEGCVVVVGSGAAGMALALALAERGRRVLLLESGGDPRDRAGVAASSRLNEGEVVGGGYTGLTGGRSRVFGGATQLWHGQCVRLQPSDVAPRAWVPGSGWPLPFAELERWYPAAERFFGLSGRGYGAERWGEHPGLAPLAWDAQHLVHDFTEYTTTPHLGTAHRARLRRSALVTVLEHATVARVLLAGSSVRGVEVALPGGSRREVPAASVVLAAGAVENARILMLSDPAGTGLGTGAEHTGRWLQDHAVVATADLQPLRGAWLQDRYSHLHRGRRRLYPKVALSAAAQEREQLVAANAVLVHEHDEDAALTAARRVAGHVRARRFDAAALADVATAAGASPVLARTAYRRYARGLSGGVAASRVWLQVWLEQVPDRDSRVLLSSRRDAMGLPRVAVDWRVGQAEMATSRAFTRYVAADLERAGAARVVPREVMVDDAAWRAAVGDSYHPSGTTRMSADPRGGVVDPDGGVHGIAGLHVAGSSTFPIAGYANPTLTIVALALRLAGQLASSAVEPAAAAVPR